MAASEADLVDLYPFNGGYSVMGVDAESAVGLLGLLLFIDLMRVHFFISIKDISNTKPNASLISSTDQNYESTNPIFTNRLKKNHDKYW